MLDRPFRQREGGARMSVRERTGDRASALDNLAATMKRKAAVAAHLAWGDHLFGGRVDGVVARLDRGRAETRRIQADPGLVAVVERCITRHAVTPLR